MPDTPVTPSPQATAPGAPETPAGVQLCVLRWSDPWRWLVMGARDVARAWGVALFYGLCFWGMALMVAWVFRASPEYVMSMASGCLLLGPFLAMGLYDTSRRLEQGQGAALGRSITAWDRNLGGMGMLVLVLMVLELLWGRASLVVFAVFFETGMPSTTGVLQAIFRPENWEFIAVYLVVGMVFALLVYGATAVSMPMMLDQGTDALTAALTSLRVVLGQPGVMLLWGVLIAALVALSFLLLWGLPLVAVGPLLGCASWHAYRSAVQPPPLSAAITAPQAVDSV
ncbi:DUF2189 domain-containing protein [Comamonas sp. GB3 AK4-5]|uniref:DUF2189 domain-containing protein n=1 Tax=Comamonas sp. GB3 AK4-5 TaxID=3231487 RepID=UPI00351E8F76